MEKNKFGAYVLTDEENAALEYQKSSQSGPNCDNCVEVAFVKDPVAQAVAAIAVRNSRDPEGSRVVYDLAEWDAFLAGAKGGEFDIPTTA
jgi:uncharacterized protein DUF397